MRDFLQNLFLLFGIAVVLFIVSPDTMRGIVGLFGGLGILPMFLLMVIVSAIPRRRSRGRRYYGRRR
jgi:hypothetical protein